MQLVLVEALDAGLADKMGPRIAPRIQALELLGIDAPHIAQGMGHHLGIGIVAQQLCLHLDPGQQVAIDRQSCDLPLVEVAHQQGGLIGALTLARAHSEGLHLLGRELENLHQPSQGGIEVLGPLTHQREVVGGPVLGQQLAVAVVDQAPSRWQWLDSHPILLGTSGVDLVLHDLKIGQAAHQQTGQGKHHHQCKQRTHPKDA